MASECKIACRVNDAFDGLAHLIVEDDGAWHGEIDLVCDYDGFATVWGKDVPIRFDNGRSGTAAILSGSLRTVFVQYEDQEPGQTSIVRFRGVSALV